LSRILIASEYNAKERAHFAQSFEFCSVVASCDDADILAPGIDNTIERRFGRLLPDHDGNVQRDFNRLTNGIRKIVGLRNAPVTAPAAVTQDYEMFFFVAWSPQSLVELARIKGWRSRCKLAVAYLFELWENTLEQNRAYLKLLDQFDHVFLLHSKCLPALASYTKAPHLMLPVAVDCLLAAPYPTPPERVVDVYSIGNRSMAVHRKLLEHTRHRDFFYIYDSLSSADSLVRDWREHRMLLTSTIKRSRYFIGFSPATLAGPKSQKIGGEEVLPGRLFEGAAAGAIILGSAPDCPEFQAYFDWRDAVIEISPDGADVIGVMEELDRDPARVSRIRRANVAACLLKHDWCHRWEHILFTVGLSPRPQLSARKDRLATAAAAVLSGDLPVAAE
jgi:Glycosyl transferases group 1